MAITTESAALSGCGSSDLRPVEGQIEPTSQDTDPAWSPDGGQIAYSHNLQTVRILNLATDGTQDVTVGRSPTWSPDGAHIAFVRTGGIWVTDLATREERQLTSRGPCVFPSWAPDGQYIAFDVHPHFPATPRESSGVWIMRPDGSEQRLVLPYPAGMPSWSPDAQFLAYSEPIASAGYPEELFSYSFVTGISTRLTQDSRRDWFPAWSPTGALVAWSMLAGGTRVQELGIWVMDPDGSSPRQVSRAPAGAGAIESLALHPSWSPAGDEMVFSMANQSGRAYVLWKVRVDGTHLRQLTE